MSTTTSDQLVDARRDRVGSSQAASVPPTPDELASVDIERPKDESRLASFLSFDTANGPKVAIVNGEAGIGKTRLIDQVLGALDPEWTVLRTKALDFERNQDHAAVRALLGSATDATDSSALDNSALDNSALDNSALETAMIQLLDRVSASGPVAVVIDDVDHADDASLATLAAALRRLPRRPLAVVATVRTDRWVPGSTFAKTLGTHAEHANGLILCARPFSRDQLRAFAEGSLSRRIDDHLLDRCMEHSAGIPLYARAVLEGLVANDGIVLHGGEYQLGRAVSPALTPIDPRRLVRRVFRGDLPALELAKHLSVVRRIRFDHLDMLHDLLHAERDEIRSTFDRLTSASVLVEQGAGWHHFTHPILANALYLELGPSVRREIHGRMISGDRSNQLDRFERATHLVGSANLSDPDAIEAAVDTADSLSVRSPLAAAEWYQKALDLQPPDSVDRPAILARRAEALWRGRQPRAAHDAGMLSLEGLAPGRLRQRTIYVVTSALLDLGRCQEAADFGSLDIDEDDDLELMAQRMYLRTILGTASPSADHEAWDLAADLEQPAKPGLLISMGQSANAAGDFEHTRQIIDRLLDIAEHPAPPARRASVLEAAALLNVKAGCVAASLDCLDRARHVRPVDVGGRWHPTSAFATSRAEFLSGRWDDALATVATSSARCEANAQVNALGWLHVTEARVMIERLQLDDAAELLDALTTTTDSHLFRSVCRILLARIAMCRGDLDRAADALDTIGSDARDHGLIEPSYLALDTAFETATLAGDIRRAEAIAVELQALAQQTTMPIVTTIAELANAEAFEDADIAAAVLERSRADRADFFAARAHVVLATLGVDKQRHIDAARHLFERMGATHWLQHLAALEQGTTRRPTDLRAAAVTLNETENKLIELVRRGMTNREIAEELNYSIKTIEVYLSRLYAKLGCRSRTELLWVVDS